jgi:hypothetical protein
VSVVGISTGNDPPVPPGATNGVDVLRGVGDGLRGGVGEGVQVGSIKILWVGLGGIGVEGANVGIGEGVGEAQLTSMRMKTKNHIFLSFI